MSRIEERIYQIERELDDLYFTRDELNEDLDNLLSEMEGYDNPELNEGVEELQSELNTTEAAIVRLESELDELMPDDDDRFEEGEEDYEFD